jgi:hypothetical protein
MGERPAARYHEIGPDRTGEFLSRGYKRRHVFPHQFYYLPKCGPDGLQLARSMCGPCRLQELSEIVLYAHPSEVSEFPEKLFFDDDLCWHQQQFGKTGQIATVNLLLRGTDLHTMVHQSDLIQRAGRAAQYRTRLQNRFKGWNFMLLNAILNFAIDQNVQSVYTPTAELALRNTDPARNVGADLFDRVYDRQIQETFKVRRVGDWWHVDVHENRDLVIRAETRVETVPDEKIICLCHDIERGLGHLESDPDFAQLAEKTSPMSLTKMLKIERQSGVRATYNVVGQLLPGVREEIETEDHCLAFHSYNHRIAKDDKQLAPCRGVDYRLKGYRPPQSKITDELSEENLCFYNFEWLASSTYSLGIDTPEMRNGLVKIPIHFDDYDLYRDRLSWEVWEQRALEIIEKTDFVAFSLHDCYAPFWLTHYSSFIDKVRGLGTLKTMNEVLNAMVRSHAQ